MENYQFMWDMNEKKPMDNSVRRLSDGACIPFDPANTDYQQFKADLANGVELQDADGKPMTAEQVKTFLEGLK
jgi:hypothetical protein